MLNWLRRLWRSRDPKEEEPSPTPAMEYGMRASADPDARRSSAGQTSVGQREPVLVRGRFWYNTSETGWELPLEQGPSPVPTVEDLVESLAQPYRGEDRRHAAERLGQMGNDATQAIPVLLIAAVDVDAAVRKAASEALEAIDPEWRLYARSAGDDKAPIAALLAVLEALETAGAAPTSNLVFFLDGEEEAGSPHLGAYLDLRRDRLRAVDAWLFLDGPVHQSGRPQIAFGARGVTGMQVTVYGPVRSLHSGHYGGWAPVPGQMLAELLASMKDSTGAVLVEGFYDSVEPVGAAEREALARLPDWDAELMRELGLLRTEGAPASLEQRLLLPSLTVRGLASGNVGALTRNVIPATATAALGIRLVKGNDPDRMLDLLEEHIRAQGYHIVRHDPDHATRLRYPRIAKVEREHGYRAVRTPMAGPIVAAVVGAARRAAEGDLVLLPTLGGSLPLYLFTDRFDAAVLVVPVANHDDNQHAPDENLRIGNLWYAVDLYGTVLTMP